MSDSIPYIGFSNETLGQLPRAKKGDLIKCHVCDGHHALSCGMENGKESDMLMFFNCGDKAYLGAVAGRLTIGTHSDVHGDIPAEGDAK